MKYHIETEQSTKNYSKVLQYYQFTEDDALHLKKVQPIIEEKMHLLLDDFYTSIFKFKYATRFLGCDKVLNRHKESISVWIYQLFDGKYDQKYFDRLNYISEVHVKIGLPTHYINTAFSFIRRSIKDLAIKHKAYDSLTAIDKIIDINLDMLTVSYKEEEQEKLLDDIIFLKDVVENNGVIPHVQGIFDTTSLNLSKYECLMRLEDQRNKTLQSAFSYLSMAKNIKLYESMMHMMVEKSIQQFQNVDMEFSINISYEDIDNKNFVDYLYKKVKQFHKPQNIIFEILESDFIADYTIVTEFVHKIREYNCKIAIDDFGSGYSSMENILNLKPDIIKIDGSLIKNIDTSNESRMITKNVVNMAKELGAKTVAEYVHSKDVLEVIQNLEVDFVQGFYLHKPDLFSN
ncbi:EAL domain-containing protein [Vibrio nigripulchritudo]|uniref:EAL domain-containing protein n=1 Tax=Vibrio nigripulchritudo TaxID=28173 RepID=UPI000697250F|nr:EAL domain-containing protein [Vibrio nigripulchritudo]